MPSPTVSPSRRGSTICSSSGLRTGVRQASTWRHEVDADQPLPERALGGGSRAVTSRHVQRALRAAVAPFALDPVDGVAARLAADLEHGVGLDPWPLAATGRRPGAGAATCRAGGSPRRARPTRPSKIGRDQPHRLVALDEPHAPERLGRPAEAERAPIGLESSPGASPARTRNAGRSRPRTHAGPTPARRARRPGRAASASSPSGSRAVDGWAARRRR